MTCEGSFQLKRFGSSMILHEPIRVNCDSGPVISAGSCQASARVTPCLVELLCIWLSLLILCCCSNFRPINMAFLIHNTIMAEDN